MIFWTRAFFSFWLLVFACTQIWITLKLPKKKNGQIFDSGLSVFGQWIYFFFNCFCLTLAANCPLFVQKKFIKFFFARNCLDLGKPLSKNISQNDVIATKNARSTRSLTLKEVKVDGLRLGFKWIFFTFFAWLILVIFVFFVCPKIYPTQFWDNFCCCCLQPNSQNGLSNKFEQFFFDLTS